jgi:hypothetical protein
MSGAGLIGSAPHGQHVRPHFGRGSAFPIATYSAQASLEFPRREAPDMDVERIEGGVIVVASELNLELESSMRGCTSEAGRHRHEWLEFGRRAL